MRAQLFAAALIAGVGGCALVYGYGDYDTTEVGAGGGSSSVSDGGGRSHASSGTHASSSSSSPGSASSSASVGGHGAGAGGAAGGCTSVGDCTPPTECFDAACDAGRCVYTLPTPAKTFNLVPNDCRITQCDAEGNPAEVEDDADHATSLDPCVIATCNHGAPELTNAPGTTACGNGQHCDGQGHCGCGADPDCPQDPPCLVEHCSGGVCAPTSTDGVACGAYVCRADTCLTACAGDQDCSTNDRCAAGVCKPADGQGCGQPGDCASGFCAGGVCCDSACNDACHACPSGACAPANGGAQCGVTCDGSSKFVDKETCSGGACQATTTHVQDCNTTGLTCTAGACHTCSGSGRGNCPQGQACGIDASGSCCVTCDGWLTAAGGPSCSALQGARNDVYTACCTVQMGHFCSGACVDSLCMVPTQGDFNPPSPACLACLTDAANQTNDPSCWSAANTCAGE